MIFILLIIGIIVFFILRKKDSEVIKLTYSKKEFFIFKMILFSSLGISVLCFILAFVLIYIELNNKLRLNPVVSCLHLAGYWGVLVFFISFLCTIDAYLYLKKLEYYGFIVPENKKEYFGILNNVPYNESIYNSRNKSGSCKTSIVMGAVSFVISVAISLYALKFYFDFHFIDITFSMICLFIAVFFWIIVGVIFILQADNKKYREDVCFPDGRKQRPSLGKSIGGVIILAIITVVCIVMLYSMNLYIFKSKISADNDTLEMVQIACQEIYDEYNQEIETKWKNSYEQLTEGFDFMYYEGSGDLFEQELLKRLNVNNFDEYREKLLIADNHYTIIIEDGTVTGTYSNDHYRK